jgi:hypothetical protein
MGKTYSAKCVNCGYTTEALYFGGGMMNFTTYNGEPAINTKTAEIEVVNGMEREKIQRENPNIHFYFSDDRLCLEHQNYSVDFGGDIGVKEFKDRRLYLCPKCNKITVDFTWQGMWD